MLHVLLAGLDQLRQLVMALLEEHVDVGPGLAHGVLQPYQAVVEHHRVAGEQQQDNPESDSGQTHGRSSGRRYWHSSCARHVQARRRSRCALFKNANLSHYVAVFNALAGVSDKRTPLRHATNKAKESAMTRMPLATASLLALAISSPAAATTRKPKRPQHRRPARSPPRPPPPRPPRSTRPPPRR